MMGAQIPVLLSSCSAVTMVKTGCRHSSLALLLPWFPAVDRLLPWFPSGQAGGQAVAVVSNCRQLVDS